MADFDLINAPARDASLYLDGYSAGWVAGYVSGVETGRQHERDEAAAIWREAAHIVKTAAECPPRDVEADERRAERSAAYWVARRGEGAEP
jgi:hypothetical protein